MMMTTGLQGSARVSSRAGAPVDRDPFASAVSWNPIPPAGVSEMEPVGRHAVDDIQDAPGPFLVPQAIPGADGCNSTQLIQLRKRH